MDSIYFFLKTVNSTHTIRKVPHFLQVYLKICIILYQRYHNYNIYRNIFPLDFAIYDFTKSFSSLEYLNFLSLRV